MADQAAGTPPGRSDSDIETEAQAENELGNDLREGAVDASLEGGDEETDSRADLEAARERREADSDKFFVVGIGASAGGLEALGELVKHVPLEHMAFVVVQHLSPHHESVLTQLLSRTSKIEVATATNGTRVTPNHVYVIPPNTDLALLNGVIHLLSPPGGDRPRLPIDHFFRSLAQDMGSSAIGIILSGTGTDGTLGLRAIKEGGGLAFVQDPSSAKYDGMPRSALASGYADFCLTPMAIGQELARISKRPEALKRPKPPNRTARMQEQIVRLFLLVRSAFGNDLTRYKPSTVERRIERRMTLHRIGKLDEYVKYVESNPDELHALYKDMLIAVTNFFRDPVAFEALKGRIFPKILDGKDGQSAIRIWIPACATGEEAYSVAISLIEFLGDRLPDKRVQIFGTDVDEDSIQTARRGVYHQNIELDVSPERLGRFFVKKDGDYQISRRIRDMVVFSKQNLLRDAPFSRMDLVSCRNFLIYLQPSAQKKVLSILHYALGAPGYLMLGTSETVGDAPDLFSLVDRKNKMYAKRHTAKVPTLDEIMSVSGYVERIEPGSALRPAVSLQALADRKILEVYGPPGVLINENLDILHFRGHTGPYLDPSPGSASFSIMRLARPELHIELTRSIQEAFGGDKRVATEVKFREGEKVSAVRLDIVPVQEPETKTRCLLVSFMKLEPPEDLLPAPVAESETDQRVIALGKRMQELEWELKATKEYLQSTIEDKESANEELKSANEELQSANEELQSANEELETSREEMQSSNEELTTVNEELQNRMAELSQTNDDLHNVLVGLDSPTIIVGMDLRVRRYTASAERVLDLAPADVGRSISFLDGFTGLDTRARVHQVIETLVTVEDEVVCRNQHWYSLRVTPYKTLDHSIRGAVVTLTDIDVRKRSAELVRDVGQYAGKFLAAIHHPLLIMDGRLRIIWANEAFYSTFQAVSEETVGNIFPAAAPLGIDSQVLERLEQTVRTGQPFRDLPVSIRLPNEGERSVKLGASRVPLPTDSVLILVSIEE
ncbi:MAG TPA: chemotaxis protein CheB [Candidatus Eisenbacteria bacterium]|nr:chemotaxis protein CheB [Candidatus Eisenbacteria bacterium]